MPSILDAVRSNSIPSHQNIIKSPRLRWGTGHWWWRSWGHWDLATTSAGRWGFPSSATQLHTFLWVGPHPSGALLCTSLLGLAPMGQQWGEEHQFNEDFRQKNDYESNNLVCNVPAITKASSWRSQCRIIVCLFMELYFHSESLMSFINIQSNIFSRNPERLRNWNQQKKSFPKLNHLPQGF